jgi:hypothetical protein
VLSGLAEARVQQYELAMFTAWRTAHFMRAGKLPARVPSIRKAKRTATPDRPQSSAEVLSVMRQLMAMTNRAPDVAPDPPQPPSDTE